MGFLTEKLLILLHLRGNITQCRRLLLTHPAGRPIGEPLCLMKWLYPIGQSTHQSGDSEEESEEGES